MSADKNCMHGIAAEFDDAEGILNAARAAKAAGYKDIKAYTPLYVEGLNEIIDDSPNIFPWLVVGGLFAGAVFGMAFQYFASVEGYPINVGGRPLFSWPAFIPVSFELAILFAALALVGAMASLLTGPANLSSVAGCAWINARGCETPPLPGAAARQDPDSPG